MSGGFTRRKTTENSVSADYVFDGFKPHHYAAIVCDPPWRFKSYTPLDSDNWDERRDVDKHYVTMDLDSIAALPVGDLATRDSHLFLWATGPNLPGAFEVIIAWGFRYSSMAFAWVKLKRSTRMDRLAYYPLTEDNLHVGLGLTTRHNVELCLLARRGNARRLSKSVREVILAPVREHSRKPDQVYDRVETYCRGPYLELFSRETSRQGWTLWGSEIGKFRHG